MHNLNFGTRNLTLQNAAAMLPAPDVPRGRFITRTSRKMTMDAGYLSVFLCHEMLPGDHFRYKITPLVRMQTLITPMMSNQTIETFLFYCSNRLVWAGPAGSWVAFNGEVEPAFTDNPITLTVPVLEMPADGFVNFTIFDDFGLPCEGQIIENGTINVSALPLRMYNKIYNEHFRDQNLINSLTVETDNGPDQAGLYLRQKRAKAHDYFTMALPWPQKFQAPTLSIGDLAPIIGLGIETTTTPDATDISVVETSGLTEVYPKAVGSNINNIWMDVNPTGPPHIPLVFADLSEATSITVNQLRTALLIQQSLEKDARYGTRYIEKIYAHFRVKSPDARLQRSEYIGGGSTPLNVQAIAQTAPVDGEGVGNLGATGLSAGQHGGSFAATEHGYVIGIINIRTELVYQQGLERHWSRSTPEDFYVPSLAGLGEQAILRKEIWCRGDGAGANSDESVFGYVPRWEEYRTDYSRVTNRFKSYVTGNIDEWHLAQQFTSEPTLGQTFIEDTPPVARVLAAGSTADTMQYIADIYIEREATRPVPIHGIPATLGRF